METGVITISRAMRKVELPARFQLVAAMNPCPCGQFGNPAGLCHCTPDQVGRYRNRVSGPLIDRIDIQIEVPPVPDHDLTAAAATRETSDQIRLRVEAVRRRQLARQGKPNSRLAASEIDSNCALDGSGRKMLKRAVERLSLSARGFHRILKVARTIADMADSERILDPHVAEALHYRNLERR